jgi:hypothetical protein
VAARALGVWVLHATVAEGGPYVRTRFPYGPKTSAGVMIRSMEREALVALAGEVVEQGSESASERDRENAQSYALRVILLRDAIGEDEVTDASVQQHVRAEQLVDQLREKAATLVETSMQAIERVASALEENGVLDQSQIDALIAT